MSDKVREDAVFLLRSWVLKGAPIRECGEMVDRILASLRDTERAAVERERKAFVAGVKWGCNPLNGNESFVAEAVRRYLMPETGGEK